MDYKEIDKDTLKELQNVELTILQELDRICRANNIDYFLVGGTLLGAVRHQGFIPWDDDIDVGMTRENYDKFLSIASKNLDECYYIQSGYDDTNWLPCSKIRKKNTLVDEYALKNIDVPKGIFIDIFPYDNLKRIDGLGFRLKSSIIRNISQILLCKHKIKKITKCRNKLFAYFLNIFSIKKLKKIQLKLMVLNNNQKCKYYTSYCGSYHVLTETVPVDFIEDTKEIKFNNYKFKCPNKTDDFLKHVYGDYMKLPPIDKRVNHAMVRILFDSDK